MNGKAGSGMVNSGGPAPRTHKSSSVVSKLGRGSLALTMSKQSHHFLPIPLNTTLNFLQQGDRPFVRSLPTSLHRDLVALPCILHRIVCIKPSKLITCEATKASESGRAGQRGEVGPATPGLRGRSES